MFNFRGLKPVMLVLLMLLALPGCASRTYDLRLSLDPQYAESLGDEHVFVHVIPITQRNRWSLAAVSVDEYWRSDARTGQIGDNPTAHREPDTRIFELSAENPRAVLSRKDPVWSRWHQRSAQELLVLSSRPVPPSPVRQDADSRRALLPSHGGIFGPDSMEVTVTREGLRVNR